MNHRKSVRHPDHDILLKEANKVLIEYRLAQVVDILYRHWKRALPMKPEAPGNEAHRKSVQKRDASRIEPRGVALNLTRQC